MNYLLDTNVCSAFVKRPSSLFHKFVQHSGRLATTTIVLAELSAWAYRRQRPDTLLRPIENELLSEVTLLDFDRRCANRFGRLRAELLSQGIGGNPVDLMFAAVALEHDLTLVTHNVRHFEPIPGLRVEDWLQP